MRSLIVRSLMAALTIGTLAVSQVATAQTETPVEVYGNDGLGSLHVLPLAGTIVDEAIALAGGTNVAGLSHSAIAQGFQTGVDGCDLSSVDIGLYMRYRWPSIDVALYSSVNVDGLDMPDQRLRSFVGTPTNGPFAYDTKAVYNFVFDAATPIYRLEPSTKYWVVLSYTPQTSGQPTFYWNSSIDNQNYTAMPVTKNNSGIYYLGTVARHGFAEAWKDHGPVVSGSNTTPQACLRIALRGVVIPTIVNPEGGGGNQEPPVLACYALSKGFFKNKYPAGWPASVIADGGAVIGGRIYTIPQLRTMLETNSTGGNQIGQLASQLVAVHLSRELARQTAGPDYAGWNGWAPDSAAAQAAYDQAAELVNANAGFDSRGRLTGTVRNASSLINTLDAGYIQRFHCN